jgi:alpha-1,3-fucosyltransferase
MNFMSKIFFRSKLKRAIIISITFIILLIINSAIDETHIDFLVLKNKEKNIKVIQLLTERFSDSKNWSLSELGSAPFQNCPEKRCHIIKPYNLLQKPREDADGIMVHGPDLKYIHWSKNYKRSQRQIWLFHSMEPYHWSFCSHHFKLTDLDNWFNLTATYKLDSDILMDYKPFKSWNNIVNEHLYVKAYQTALDNKVNLKRISKTKEALWFVSHCQVPSEREKYVNEMSKYIKIDIFGKCADSDPCLNAKENSQQCTIDLYNQYKFYLAFEVI